MAVDVIATQGVGDRTAIILTYVLWDIPVNDEGPSQVRKVAGRIVVMIFPAL